MILTPLNIQVAIIKAFYALAKKSVKYYTGLALGKNNTCLFKEIRLLRAYVEILRNFEIVGSTITCSCCVEGDYTVLLNSALPVTDTPIQFGCDNQGYMIYNNVGYNFTYWYDEPNKKIVIEFTSDVPNPNLVSNPTMASNLTGWNPVNFTYSSYKSGSALYNGEGDDGYLVQDVLEVGKSYIVKLDLITELLINDTNDNYISVFAGTNEKLIFSGSITSSNITSYNINVTCFGNTEFKIFGKNITNPANANFYIKNIDVREVLGATITVTDVQFTPECNITGTADSPIEVAEMVVNHELAITISNEYGTWNGNISILSGSTVLESRTIPAAIMNDPIAIVEWWAIPGNGLPDWILLYDVDRFVLYSPFNNINYDEYTAQFNQYQGGSDSSVNFDLSDLMPFVTQGTPAYADILFEQNTFAASHVAETLLTIPPNTLPYVDNPTLANVDILIPINQFAVGQPATMSIPLNELFNSTIQDFYYQDVLMFNHSGAYADMLELIDDFNTNNGLGFTATDGGFAPIPGEVLAKASNNPTLFNTAAFGDIYTVKLVNTPLSINTSIGTYTVGDDSPIDVANFIAASIIAQGDFDGTVNVVGTVITLTAPLGTGDSWNYVAGVSTYGFSVEKPGSRPVIFYFNGGEAPPTTPIHLLNVIAASNYPQTQYNGGAIRIDYDFAADEGIFAGAVNDTHGVVTIEDDLTGPIYTSSVNFTSVESMLINFGFYSTPAAVGSIIGNNGVNYTVRIELTYPPGYEYNGTSLRYSFDPDGSGRIYNDSGVYFGGNDTTESTYTLVILDEIDNPFLTITRPGNFQDYQAIVDDLNSQSAFNTRFIASLNGIDITITSVYSIQGSTYNGYTFQLALGYESIQYSPIYNFVTNVGELGGGIDALSPEVNFVNDYNSLVVLNLPQNSYDVNGINGFATYFSDTNVYGYSAELIGSYGSTPEILSQSILTMTNLTATPLTVIRAYYTDVPNVNSPPALRNYIGEYIPSVTADYTAVNIASGLASAITSLGEWGGTATNVTASLVLTAPSGTFGSFNFTHAIVTKTIYTRAVVVVTVSSGSFGIVIGSLQLAVSDPTVSFGQLNINGAHDASYWAVAYANQINLGTGTHGYTATASAGRSTISIKAPLYSGAEPNSKEILVLTANGGVAIDLSTTPTFSGGSEISTDLKNKFFIGGGYTYYDQVRFTANPTVQTWIYNDEYFIYNNITDIYDTSDKFSGGIDTTIGRLYLILFNTPVNYPNPGDTFAELYLDLVPFNYGSFQRWSDVINAATTTNLDFSTSTANTDFIVYSPLNSFAYFNEGPMLLLGYDYDSPQYNFDNEQELPITNGLAPILTPYEGDFVAGVLGNFINSDPCAPTTVTQTCLTNSQVSKIITHINKLVR